MTTTQPAMVSASASSQGHTRRLAWTRILRIRPLVIGGIIVSVILLAAIFAGWLSPYPPDVLDYNSILQGMSWKHLLGTDDLGRDVLSRILFGTRTSMEVTVGSVLLGLLIGVPVGLVSGFYRGFVDDWLVMRIVDALQSFPFLILALVLASVLGPGIRNAMIAIGIGYIPIFVRIVRGQVISEAKREYVEAARIIGASDWRIMARHIFRNITTPLIVQVSITMAGGIIAEASLSYLGLGAQPPTASWGSMLRTAQGYLGQAPWLAIVPGLAIAIAVLGFNLLGDGLQALWDPKSQT